MATSGGAITLRLSLAGSEEVKAALASLGPAGARAMREIEAAQAGPNAGMRALNSLSEDLHGKFDGLAEAVGPLGGALKALGPAGLAAAAGIGAVIAIGDKIVEATLKTAEWAEATDHFAKMTGMSTTAVQEFDFVATALGIPVDKAREQLAGLGKVIGTLQDNLARNKGGPQVRLFEAILGTEDAKSTDEKLRQLGSIQAILPKILDYVARFPATEREGFAKALRMDPETLNTLVDGRDKIAGLIAEAHEYGIVVDENLIKKSAEAAEKLHVAGAVAEGELRVALAHLTPEISAGAEAFAHMAKSLADFVRDCTDALGPIQALIGKLQSIPHDISVALHIPQLNLSPDQKKQLADAGDSPVTDPLYYPKQLGKLIGQLAEQGRAAQTKAGIKNMLAGGHYDGPTGDGMPETPTGGAALPPDAAGGRHHAAANHDDSAEAEAHKALLEAEIKATQDLDQQHVYRLQLIDAERDAALKAAADKKGLSPSARDDLVKAAGLTHDADVRAEKQRYAKAQADPTRAFGDAMAKAEDDALKAQVDASGSLRARQALERRQLAAAQAKEDQDAADVAIDKNLSILEIAELDAARESAHDAQSVGLAHRQQAEIAAEAAKVAAAGLQGQIDQLRATEAVTKNMGDRRALQLKLFDLEEQQREDEARAATQTGSAAARAAAQARLDSLTSTAGARRQAVSEQFPGNAWDAEMQKMRSDTGSLGQEWDQLAAGGIERFNSELFDSQGRIQNMGQVFRSVITDMLKMLEQYLLKQAEIGVFGGGGGGASAQGGSLNAMGLLGTLFGGGGGGGLAAAGSAPATEIAGDIMMTGGLADGGPTRRALRTGLIRAPGGTKSDGGLIRVSDREFVVNAEATSRHMPLLMAMNENRPIRGFAAGGYTGPSAPDYSGALGGGQTHFHQDFSIHAPGADAAALERVATAQKQYARGEPQRFAAYVKATRKQGSR
jgi:hypothetical protein